jgi:PmbA protein
MGSPNPPKAEDEARLSEELLADLLEQARRRGATEADIMAVESLSASALIRMKEVDRVTHAAGKRLGLRIFFGKRSAVTSTSDLSPDSLSRLLDETSALARVTSPDEASGLPEGGLLPGPPPDLGLADPRVHSFTIAEAIDRAMRGEAAAFATDDRIANSKGADFHFRRSRIYYASSIGFLGSYDTSTFSLSVTPVAAVNGTMQRDYWYTTRRHLSALDEPEAVGRKAAERAVRRLGARKVSTQTVPVIFDPETASTLLGHLCSAVSGTALYKGASFLQGQLGEAIASPAVTVYDDGKIPGGLGSRPFDGEGLPTRKTAVVDRGMLQSYLLDTYSGRKLGLATTGNAVRGIGDSPAVGPTNFYLEEGPHAPEEIIRSVDRGLLVTELIGFGVNLVTGDYSRGAAGFWIENGEIAYPVEEITIAGNLKEMLRDIEMVGSDLDFRTSVAAPTIKIARMTVAGH